MFKGFVEAHDEGIDGVGSIHDEIKVIAPMEDLFFLRALRQNINTVAPKMARRSMVLLWKPYLPPSLFLAQALSTHHGRGICGRL